MNIKPYAVYLTPSHPRMAGVGEKKRVWRTSAFTRPAAIKAAQEMWPGYDVYACKVDYRLHRLIAREAARKTFKDWTP